MPRPFTRHRPACPGDPIFVTGKWIARTSRAMTILIRAAMCVGTVALLAGAGPNPTLPHIRSIGIIAALGDTCVFERVPDTAFNWIAPPKASFLEISDWNIDDEVTNAIAKQLGTRYRVQSIAIEHQDFDAWTYNSLARHIRELPIPETPADAYLLVLRDWQRDAIGNTSQLIGGLGLYRRDASRGGRRYGAFAAYRLVLLDANRGDLIASHPALLRNGRQPWLPVSASLWPPTPNDLKDAQRNVLKTDFIRLIEATLPHALSQIGFTE
jgi:hypothetical protein